VLRKKVCQLSSSAEGNRPSVVRSEFESGRSTLPGGPSVCSMKRAFIVL